MVKTRQEIEKQIKELQEQLAEMPWEPKGGRFVIQYDGTVFEDIGSHHKRSEFGIEYTTRKQAEKAAKAMRAHNRLVNYVMEKAPDWEPDWGDVQQVKCVVYLDVHNKKWFHYRVFSDFIACAVHMPPEVAKDLVVKLNNGEVEL